jgi:predicted MFS family arabinose efflux permease
MGGLIRPYLTVFILNGIVIGYYSGSLHTIIEKSLPASLNSEEVNAKTTLVLLVLGMGEILGSYLSGYLSEKV